MYKSKKKIPQASIRAEAGATYTARMEDLSEVGFFIKTQKVFPHGTILEISLKGSTEPIVILCRVVWARKASRNLFHLANKNGMGVLITEFKKGEYAYHHMQLKTHTITGPCNHIDSGQICPLYITAVA